MILLNETIFLFKCDTLFYTQITYFGKIRSQRYKVWNVELLAFSTFAAESNH